MAETRIQEHASQLRTLRWEGLTHGRDGWDTREAMMIIVADTHAGDTGNREVGLPRDIVMTSFPVCTGVRVCA